MDSCIAPAALCLAHTTSDKLLESRKKWIICISFTDSLLNFLKIYILSETNVRIIACYLYIILYAWLVNTFTTDIYKSCAAGIITATRGAPSRDDNVQFKNYNSTVSQLCVYIIYTNIKLIPKRQTFFFFFFQELKKTIFIWGKFKNSIYIISIVIVLGFGIWNSTTDARKISCPKHVDYAWQ